MSDTNAKEYENFMGPDSLRRYTQLSKALFDQHTKRFTGYEDINGSKYEGTVENFGAEMLLETRKLLMDKVSLKHLFIENTMEFYFNIEYSGFVNTYDQQNMLCAKLKKDVFLSSKEYRISFTNFSYVSIPRAESSSDPNVIRDRFLVTSTPPVLMIKNEDNTITNVELRLTDINDSNTVYYFHIGLDTDNFIDTDISDVSVFVTIPIDDSMFDIPFIWMCVDTLKYLPDLGLSNNIYSADLPIFTIGNNGHDSAMRYHNDSYGGGALMYPYMNGAVSLGNIPPSLWIIKATSSEETGFNINPKDIRNYTAKIDKIYLLRYDTHVDVPSSEPTEIIELNYYKIYSKIMLFTDDIDHTIWNFRKPTYGDYDYDSETGINKVYAYTSMDNFINNATDGNILIAAFSIAFSDRYLYNLEEYCCNAYAGVHVDNTSDLSVNGISKKYGTIHDLGDFDGLPPYFQYMIDDKLHRAHVEMYAIRDKLNDVNHPATEKPTAGLLFDSGIPKMDNKDIPIDYPISIKYNPMPDEVMEYRYDNTIPEIDKKNYLTEMTYTDPDNVGNCKMIDHAIEPKFIYHGKGMFSLTYSDELDPLNEYGRVYVISNDKAEYENNGITQSKAPATFARICDIPTEFSQLINVEYYAPGIVLDENYVRTECCFTTNEKDMIYNRTTQNHVIMSPTGSLVFYHYNTDTVEDLFEEQYPQYYKLNETITLNTNTVSFTDNNDWMNYSDEAIVNFYICGGKVLSRAKVQYNGGVPSAITSTFAPNDDGEITTKRSNWESKNIKRPADLYSGTGDGWIRTFTIDDTVWDDSAMFHNYHLTEGLYFVFDPDMNLWAYIWDRNSHSFVVDSQLSGITEYPNEYDVKCNIENTNKDAFLYNILKGIDKYPSYSYPSYSYVGDIQTTIPSTVDISNSELICSLLHDQLINQQDTFYIVKSGSEEFHTVDLYFRDDISKVDGSIRPMNSDLGLNSKYYRNKSNTIHIGDKDHFQPSLSIYDPVCSMTYSFIDDTPSDIKIINSSGKMRINGIIGGNHGNVYMYNEYDNKPLVDKREELDEAYDTHALETYITSNIGDATIISSPHTKDDLLDYIIENTYDYGYEVSYDNRESTPYRKPEISVLSTGGNTDIHGDVVSVSDDIIDPKVHIENSSTYFDSIPYYFLKLDEDIELTNDYVVKDINGVDISDYVIIIINKQFYVRYNSTWTRIRRKAEDVSE